MNEEIIYKKLLEAYEANDVESFEEINSRYNLGLISIEQVELIELRPTIDLSEYYVNYNAQYMKNYTTSRLLVNLEPLPKYKLKEPEFNIVSYSYMIYHVLTALQINPNLDEVLDNVELQIPKDTAKNILISEGFIDVEGKTASVTQYGFFRLSGVSWVSLYDTCLDYFDFDDFERYMQEYDTGNVVKNAFNYLDEHLKIARQNREFNRLYDVYSSKALLYLNEERFKNALIEELKIFVLKLNPVYLDKKDLKDYKAVEYPNINNIFELNDLAEVKSLKRVLYKAWMDVEFDEMYLDKKEAFKYLTRTKKGEVLDDLSDEIADKYFK